MVACIVMHIQRVLQRLSHYFVGHMACYIAAAYSGSYRIAPSTAAHPANGDVLPNPEKLLELPTLDKLFCKCITLGRCKFFWLGITLNMIRPPRPLRGQE